MSRAAAYLPSTPQGRFKILSWVRVWLPPRHRKQRRDVVHRRLHAGPGRLKAGQPQQVECCCAQREQRSGPVAPVAVGILLELGVRIQCQPSMLQRSRTSCSRASGVVRRLLRNRWVAQKGLLPRVPVPRTSTSQLVPIRVSVMCSGACFASSVQMMSRPWLIS